MAPQLSGPLPTAPAPRPPPHPARRRPARRRRPPATRPPPRPAPPRRSPARPPPPATPHPAAPRPPPPPPTPPHHAPYQEHARPRLHVHSTSAALAELLHPQHVEDLAQRLALRPLPSRQEVLQPEHPGHQQGREEQQSRHRNRGLMGPCQEGPD